MQVMSAMILLEIPHVTIMTKMDLCPYKTKIYRFLSLDGQTLVSELKYCIETQFQKMDHKIGNLLDDYFSLSFLLLDITDENSITSTLMQIDIALEYEEKE